MSISRNAGPLANLYLGSALMLVLVSAAHAQEAAPAPAAPASCEALDADQGVQFDGRALRDSPGLQTPAARKLNAQLSRGECMESARLALATPSPRRIRSTRPNRSA